MTAVVARIGKPHGLRGEVTVQLHTDAPEERFAPGAVLDTEPDRGTLTVAGTRVHQGVWLLRFEEVADRTGAEALRGTRLVAEEDEAEDEDAWYEDDLVGAEVRDPAGTRLGEVVALEVRPAQDLLEVRLLDGRTRLVPFVAALVPHVAVDSDDPHVVVDAPPGLFDLES
ncbi:ribosome maturation factor RimM [Mobilicoccus pelagius]|uniref:Ribosome maturation factor RimM n=1 Tax=Mobilicoccus pelagius NBRC 104925 TaxID=1089455 RepID=H5UNB1_9MICO|nr:ribosome maturation factor RimM [Mobilicoccus pelagius]GAB47219.1 ribosome maturation factor RimM [Mobilicoccus pelagius NBRC 104925]